MTVHDVEQRSPEWTALRLGRVTASRAGDVVATIKAGEAAARRNYRVQLVLERITGRSQERGYVSGPMQDGIEREPDAVARYELLSGVLVHPVGFVSHDTLMAGCSPDGFLGADGLVSIKAPIPATHLEYLRTGIVPRDYRLQIVHEAWITGRRWCDWMSYQPDFPEELQAKIVRVTVADAELVEYEKAALAFLAEVDRDVSVVRSLSNVGAVLAAAVS